jgi:hypothetical protein
VLTLDAVLLGVLLPAAVAGVLLLLGRIPGLGGVFVALSIGGGYLAGHVGLRGFRGWVPRESTERVAAIVAAGVVVAVLGLTRRGRLPVRLALHFGLGAAAAWYLAGGHHQRASDLWGAALQVGLVAAATTLLWWRLEAEQPHAPAVDARGGAAQALLLAVAAGGAAGAIGLSGSQVLAQLAGALTAAVAGGAVAGRLLGAAAALPRSAAPFALGYVALLFAATSFADLPPVSAGLLALAPLPAAGAARGGFTPRLAVVLGTLGAAGFLAYEASPSFAGL